MKVNFEKAINEWHSACKSGQVSLLEDWIKKAMATSERWPWSLLISMIHGGWTAACLEGKTQVIQWIINDPSMKEWVALNEDPMAPLGDWSDCIQDALNNEYNFFDACSCGHVDLIRYLIFSPDFKRQELSAVNPHQEGDIALMWACMSGQLEVVQFLLEAPEFKREKIKPLNIQANGNVALNAACRYGHLNVISWMMDKLRSMDQGLRSIPQEDWQSMLLESVRQNQYKVVDFLVDQEVQGHPLMDIHAFHGDYGTTPLTEAVRNNHWEIVNFLLRAPEKKSSLRPWDQEELEEIVLMACEQNQMDQVQRWVMDLNVPLTPKISLHFHLFPALENLFEVREAFHSLSMDLGLSLESQDSKGMAVQKSKTKRL